MYEIIASYRYILIKLDIKPILVTIMYVDCDAYIFQNKKGTETHGAISADFSVDDAGINNDAHKALSARIYGNRRWRIKSLKIFLETSDKNQFSYFLCSAYIMPWPFKSVIVKIK